MINKMPSSSAQDRPIAVWFQKIENGEIKLPRFQRPQAWDKARVRSLLDTVTKNLPLGVTLLLNVDEEQFESRYLATAPETGGRVTEHLLDGQQRLTALWRSLHNNYSEVKYFLYVGKFNSDPELDDKNDVKIISQNRWKNKQGATMPLWADVPADSFKRGFLPLELFRPGDVGTAFESWVTEAIASSKPTSGVENYEGLFDEWYLYRTEILSFIRDYRETISHFNLPYLALPVQTSKDTALQVFINMNTNSKPLSQYDIIRAEIEGVKGISLDDYQTQLDIKHPTLKFYSELPFLVLATSALMQDKLPSQKGMWEMKKDLVIENWERMALGLARMAEFLESQGIYDKSRLPTNAVLAVIAALYSYIPEGLDARGNAETLLKKYLWSSFFTGRYESAADSYAYSDFIALKKVILQEIDSHGKVLIDSNVPVFDRIKYPLSTEDELLRSGWPKREGILSRGIMAVFSKFWAFDFADGSPLSRRALQEGKRHYHHVFPAALLKEAGINPDLVLNCAMISDKTNQNISNKEPFRYLKERYNWTTEEIVSDRLKSHLVPIEELKNGGYDGLSTDEKNEKVKNDFESFVTKRAKYVVKAVAYLSEGREISAAEIMQEVELYLNTEL